MQPLQLQDVPGDGNCCWHSLAVALQIPPHEIKRRALAGLPALRAWWFRHMPAFTEELWVQLIEGQSVWGTFANESMLASFTQETGYPVLIISDAQASFFYRGDKAVALNNAIVLHLHQQHFQFVTSGVPSDLGDILMDTETSGPVCSLLGGGVLPSVLTTWNVGGLAAREEALAEITSDVLLLQETGATARQQKRMDRSLESKGWSVIWGEPTPLGMDASRRYRPQCGKVPGVAICHRSKIDLRIHEPNTAGAKHLVKRGRLLLATYPTLRSKVLIGCLYLPSGWSERVLSDRRACLDDLACEMATYGDAPIVLGGDWNHDPSTNPLVPALCSKGWMFPTPVMRPSDPSSGISEPYTYAGTGSSSVLDYWLVSKHCMQPVTQQIHSHITQHLPVSLKIDPYRPSERPKQVPYVCRYRQACPPRFSVRWAEVHVEVTRHLDNNQIERAWERWQQGFHDALSAVHSETPRIAPGCVALKHARPKHRLTQEGSETPLVSRMMRLSRQLKEWSITHSEKLAQQIQQSIASPPLSMHASAWQRDPVAVSKHVLNAAREQQQRVVQRRVQAWKRDLTTATERPTGALFRWLRHETPAANISLRRDGENLHSMSDIFSAHRDFWQRICSELRVTLGLV